MIFWFKYPFIRLLLPFVSGIILCYYTESYISFPFFIPAAVILLLLFILLEVSSVLTYSHRWIAGALLNTAIVTLGYSLTSQTFLKNQPLHFANARIKAEGYIARVTMKPEFTKNYYKLVLDIEALSSNQRLQIVSGKCICYIQKRGTNEPVLLPRFGDVLSFYKKPFVIKSPQNPGEFNYKDHLENQGIFHSVWLKSGDYRIIAGNEGFVNEHLNAVLLKQEIKSFAYTIRSRLLKIISSSEISGDEYAIAAALLTGYDEKIEPELMDSYSAAGVIHILSVSGLHVGIIFLLADFVFRLFRRWHKFPLIRPVAIITIVWLYATVTGMASPVVRASIMFTFITLGTTFRRHNNGINLLAAAAFLILVFDPRALFNIGFQLSFSAVGGILLFQPVLKKLWNPVNPILIHVRDLLTISIAAQIFTTPFVLYYFHRFPVYFLLSNIVAIPLSGLIMYTGIFLLLTSWIPFLSNISSVFLSFQIRILNGFVRYIEEIPGAVIDNIHLSFLNSIILMSLFASTLLLIKYRNKGFVYIAAVCLGLLIMSASIRQFNITRQQKIIFHRVNDGTLISLIDGKKHVLISDSSLSENRSLLDYKLKGLRAEAGLNEPSITFLKMAKKNNLNKTLQLPEFYNFHDKRIVIIDSDSYLPDIGKKLKVDYVLLSDCPDHAINQLKDNFPGALFIAGNSLKGWEYEKLKRDGQAIGIQIYSLIENGALVIDIES